MRTCALQLLRFGGSSFQLQLQNDFFANQIIGFTRVFDIEIEPVEHKVGSYFDSFWCDLNHRGKRNLLRHTMQREVAGYRRVRSARCNTGYFESCRWHLIDVE